MPVAALIAIIVAILLAGGVVFAMLSSSRPEGGWNARVKDVFQPGPRSEHAAGVLAEHRDVVQADGVSISAILRDAEEDSGYYAVPKRYEDRIEAVAVRVANGVDRVRARRERPDA